MSYFFFGENDVLIINYFIENVVKQFEVLDFFILDLGFVDVLDCV